MPLAFTGCCGAFCRRGGAAARDRDPGWVPREDGPAPVRCRCCGSQSRWSVTGAACEGLSAASPSACRGLRVQTAVSIPGSGCWGEGGADAVAFTVGPSPLPRAGGILSLVGRPALLSPDLTSPRGHHPFRTSVCSQAPAAPPRNGPFLTAGPWQHSHRGFEVPWTCSRSLGSGLSCTARPNDRSLG